MLAVRLPLCLMVAIAALGQTSDIYERLRRALGPFGEGESASQELAKGHFRAVEEMLARRAVFESSNRAELISLEGAVAFLGRDMRQAVALFGKAAELAPLNDSDAFTLAMALVSSGEDQRASGVVTRLAQKHPEQPIYVYWLGRIEYDLRRYPEAVEKLQKAVELDPKSARAWDSLGLAFDMEGEMEEAYRAFTKAVDLNRNLPQPSAWPPHNLGYWYLRRDRLPEAENLLRESIRFDPKLLEAHYHLARALEKEGRDGEAMAEYKTAISEDSVSTDACYSLAMLYKKLGRDREANATFGEYKRRKEARGPTERR